MFLQNNHNVIKDSWEGAGIQMYNTLGHALVLQTNLIETPLSPIILLLNCLAFSFTEQAA